MGFLQDRAGKRYIPHRRHKQLGGVSVCCMEYVERRSTAAADNRMDKLAVRELNYAKLGSVRSAIYRQTEKGESGYGNSCRWSQGA